MKRRRTIQEIATEASQYTDVDTSLDLWTNKNNPTATAIKTAITLLQSNAEIYTRIKKHTIEQADLHKTTGFTYDEVASKLAVKLTTQYIPSFCVISEGNETETDIIDYAFNMHPMGVNKRKEGYRYYLKIGNISNSIDVELMDIRLFRYNEGCVVYHPEIINADTYALDSDGLILSDDEASLLSVLTAIELKKIYNADYTALSSTARSLTNTITTKNSKTFEKSRKRQDLPNF